LFSPPLDAALLLKCNGDAKKICEKMLAQVPADQSLSVSGE
jgi:hypothetical protein